MAKNTINFEFNRSSGVWDIKEIENDFVVDHASTMSEAKGKINKLRNKAFQGFTPRFFMQKYTLPAPVEA